MTSESASETKEKVSIETYGDMISDCTAVALFTSTIPFCLGAVGIPMSLTYLHRILYTSFETKLLIGGIGALSLSIYTAKRVRMNCEKDVEKAYYASYINEI